jgi:hypothetical protein
MRCTTWRQIRSTVSGGIHQVAIAQNSTVAASIGWASPTNRSAPAIDARLAPARVVIAGGPAPLIATALLAATGSGYVIAAYIAFCAVVSISRRF